MNNKKIFKKTIHATFAATAAILLSSALLTNNQSVKAAEPAKTTDTTAKKTVDSNEDAAYKEAYNEFGKALDAYNATFQPYKDALKAKYNYEYLIEYKNLHSAQTQIPVSGTKEEKLNKAADNARSTMQQAFSAMLKAENNLDIEMGKNELADLNDTSKSLDERIKDAKNMAKLYSDTIGHAKGSIEAYQKLDNFNQKIVDDAKNRLYNATNPTEETIEKLVEEYASSTAGYIETKLQSENEITNLKQNIINYGQKAKKYEAKIKQLEAEKAALDASSSTDDQSSSSSTDNSQSSNTTITTPSQPTDTSKLSQDSQSSETTDSKATPAKKYKQSVKTVYQIHNDYKVRMDAKFHTFKGLVKYAQKHNFSLRFNHAKKLTVKHLASYYKVSNNSFKRTRGFLRRNKKVVVKRVAVIHGRAFAILNNGKAIIANKLW